MNSHIKLSLRFPRSISLEQPPWAWNVTHVAALNNPGLRHPRKISKRMTSPWKARKNLERSGYFAVNRRYLFFPVCYSNFEFCKILSYLFVLKIVFLSLKKTHLGKLYFSWDDENFVTARKGMFLRKNVNIVKHLSRAVFELGDSIVFQ